MHEPHAHLGKQDRPGLTAGCTAGDSPPERPLLRLGAGRSPGVGATTAGPLKSLSAAVDPAVTQSFGFLLRKMKIFS